MHFPRKRWRLALMAVLAALAVSVTFVSPAFAGETGESGTWNEEYVGNQPLESQGTVTEARNGGSLFRYGGGKPIMQCGCPSIMVIPSRSERQRPMSALR